MRKNLTIAVLGLISVLSLAYGHQQKMRADEQEARANQMFKKAEQARIMAEQMYVEASLQRVEALKKLPVVTSD